MFNLKRHHVLILILALAFVLAWAVWTFFLLPASETPSLPDPGATSGAVPGK